MNEKQKRSRLNLRSNAFVGKSFEQLYEPDLSKATGSLLTVRQISRMLGVTKATIRNYRMQRQLPYYTMEGTSRPSIRFDEGLVLDWLQFNNRRVVNDDYMKY